MTIKNTKVLYNLSILAQMPVYDFTELLISELEKKELVFNDSDNYGKTIKTVMDGTLGYLNFVSVLEAVNLPKRSAIIAEILDLILWGDGDCIECGGEMEVVDGEYREDKDTGEKIPVWEVKQCQCCGFKTSK